MSVCDAFISRKETMTKWRISHKIIIKNNLIQDNHVLKPLRVLMNLCRLVPKI